LPGESRLAAPTETRERDPDEVPAHRIVGSSAWSER
jgi:hypothetical protein